jgi:hypothetical protein
MHVLVDGQEVPQLPQLRLSVISSTHVPLHAVPVPGQLQTPAVHAEPIGHALPHVPQFDVLMLVSTHVLPHAVPPPGHAHTPAVHVEPSGHVLPHVPQLSVLVCVFTQCAGDPQAVSPPPHVLQEPAVQTPSVPQFV